MSLVAFSLLVLLFVTGGQAQTLPQSCSDCTEFMTVGSPFWCRCCELCPEQTATCIVNYQFCTAVCMDAPACATYRPTTTAAITVPPTVSATTTAQDGNTGLTTTSKTTLSPASATSSASTSLPTTTTTTVTTAERDQSGDVAKVLAAVFGTLLVCLVLAFGIYIYEVHLCFVKEQEEHAEEMHEKEVELAVEVKKEHAAEAVAARALQQEAIAEHQVEALEAATGVTAAQAEAVEKKKKRKKSVGGGRSTGAAIVATMPAKKLTTSTTVKKTINVKEESSSSSDESDESEESEEEEDSSTATESSSSTPPVRTASKTRKRKTSNK